MCETLDALVVAVHFNSRKAAEKLFVASCVIPLTKIRSGFDIDVLLLHTSDDES
jgi:hypothetical protein